MRMDEREQDELSALLARQREGDLDANGRSRLDALMRRYRTDMTRKAQAMAVERGLRPALGEDATSDTAPYYCLVHMVGSLPRLTSECVAPQSSAVATASVRSGSSWRGWNGNHGRRSRYRRRAPSQR
jgi:hypothetical protein